MPESLPALRDEGAMVNVTLSLPPTRPAGAKAGASFISPFIGRLDAKGEDGMQVIRDIRTVYDIMVLRPNCSQQAFARLKCRQCALIGADVVTVPPKVLRELVRHELTDKARAVRCRLEIDGTEHSMANLTGPTGILRCGLE